MFSIFSKQLYLADFLEGAIDMHSHLLPGIDDGAKTLEVSKSMVTLYKNMGYMGIIATPHIMEDYYCNTAATITDALRDFKNQSAHTFQVPYRAAAEYMLDTGFNTLLEKKELLTLSENKVLVEMSYFQKYMHTEQQIFAMQNQGYSPILAHPERYSYVQLKDSKEFKRRGCSLQLNLLSLSNHYGNEVQKKAYELLTENMIDFVATDAHKPLHLEKIRQIKIPKKMEQNLKRITANTREAFGIST